MTDQQPSLLPEDRTLTPDEMMPASVQEPRELAAQPTPMELLQVAIEKDIDTDKLEKLMELQERWEANQARRLFSEAMHACQQEMPMVIRDAENSQTKSRYARLERIQHDVRPVYSQHGFSLSYGEGQAARDGYKRTICDVRHSAGHVEQYHLDLPIDGVSAKGNPIGSMNPVQAAVSTTTYGQRRLLCMIFNITVAGEDFDGGPVPHDAPDANPNAPSAAPRGERVTSDMVKSLGNRWGAQTKDPDKDGWFKFIAETTGREFDPGYSANWTMADYRKCAEALGVPE